MLICISSITKKMNRRNKTLVLGEAFYPEDFIINDLVQEWEKEGRKIEVLTHAPSYPYGHVYKGYKNKLYQVTYFNSVKVHRFPVWQGYEKSVIVKVLNYFSFVFWSCLIVLFIGRRFDRVFIYQTGPLTLATAGVLMRKLFKCQVTIWTQDLWPETVYAYGFKQTKALSWCLNHFVVWVYRNCDHIMVSCEGFIGRLKRFVPDKAIDFVPNWSLVKYSPCHKVNLPGKLNFTFAGNIGKVQNLENVVRGFGLFVKDYPDVWLNIIGEGSFLQELKEIVDKENISNVNFTGRKPLEEMSDYYHASDVLVLSLKDVPLYEIMIPSKFQAYLVTCKPIYAIFKGEIRNLVVNNGLGVVANPGDINDIANGFRKWLEIDLECLETMSCHVSKLLSEVFCREKLIGKINLIHWEE